tara:strand:+ start:6066 stop:6269 length:204 start_codon:yes stop_codon:yes gene_type:complete
MTAQAFRITDETTAAELIELLGHLNANARRLPRIVGDDVIPTAWDQAHRRMDGPIDDVLEALARERG